MKVGMLTTSYPRYPGDYAGIFIHNLARELVGNNIKVTVIAPHDTITKNYEVLDGVEIFRFQYWFTKKGQKLAYGGGMPYNLSHSLSAKIQLPFFMLFFMLKQLRVTKKYDIIHAQFLLSGLIGVFVKKLTNSKLIITAHGSDICSIKKNGLFKKLFFSIISCSDKIIAVSNANKRELTKLGITKDKIDVIPNGVYPSKFDDLSINTRTGNDVHILWVGRMVDVKGLEYLIKAMKIVVSRYSNSKLTLIGDGPLRQDLEKLTNELSLNDNISFIGYIKNDDVSKYLKNTDIFVLPSTFEGFGIAALEAMNYGKPIVGSNVGGIVDIVKDQINGLLVEPRNHQQLAKKMHYLIKNPEERQRMGKESRNMVKKWFTWEKIAGKTIEIYNKI